MSEPVRDAVVHASAGDGARRIAGVPLLVRTLLVLQKAGIERVVLDGPGPVPADPRLRVAIASGSSVASGRPYLSVGRGAVIDATLATAAVAAPASARFEMPGAVLEVVRGPRATAPSPPPAGVLVPASASDGAIVRALLRGLENPRDGYLDRLVHRRLSRPTTRLLLSTSITPNQVTTIGVIVGIVGGWLLGAPSPMGVLAGIAALLVSSVLDCADGELARIKLAESKFGHVLDVTGDTLVHAALLCGITMQLARTGAWPGTATLVLLAVGVVGSFAAITWSEQTEARRHRVPGPWENRVLERVLSPLTTRDWYVFPMAFALLGRLDALVPAAAVGAQVFWVTVVVLVVRVLSRAGGHATTPSGYVVERARLDDIPRLADVEREAATLLAGYDVPATVLAETTAVSELRAAADAGRLWVARAADGAPVGFAHVELVDGDPHLEEIDVIPSHGRRGLGRALVDAVLVWARAAGHGGVTLTTFRDVPWNAPFYAQVGFRPLDPEVVPPGLVAILRDEAARGLDPARRVAMRCDLRAKAARL